MKSDWLFLQANRQLQADPKDEIQSCQEELIACKLREAEANLSMKELQVPGHNSLTSPWWKRYVVPSKYNRTNSHATYMGDGTFVF
jgi:hypothetical protein